VSLGEGVEGLLHVTEISWARVHDPREVLKVGDSVRVQIIGIDGNQRRLSLSMKRLEANPWETFAAQHSVGSRVFGKVVNLTDFGAFVEVAPAIDGLIHVSDFSWTEKVTKASDVVSVGQEIEAVILELDVESGRLGLGLKQLTQDPWASAEEIAVPGKRIDVEITRLVDFGAFARITDGIEGLIHISEMSDDRINKASEVVKVGQTVNVLVTGFDRANQRISLSIKRQELGDAGDAREYREEGSSMALGDLLRDRLNKEKTDE
jgi:small subunit ribosomal protein S1